MIGTSRLFKLVLATMLVASETGWAQAYPDKPIRIIVPFTAGSSADGVARALAPQLGSRLGVGVVIENQGGGGGFVGLSMVARSKPDGYTLVCAELGALTVVPHLRKNLPYDPNTSFVPVAKVGNVELIFASNPTRPFTNLREFVQLAKNKPGMLNYASGGTGTGAHIAAELFLQQAGIKVTHIPYKGGAPATAAAVAGDVDFVSSGASTILPMVKAGRLRALAITAPVRRDSAPGIPTAVEAGMPELIAASTYGLLAPAGTPAAVIERLRSEIAAIVNTAEFKNSSLLIGLEPDVLMGEQFTSYIAAERTKWGEVIRKGGIRMEEESASK